MTETVITSSRYPFAETMRAALGHRSSSCCDQLPRVVREAFKRALSTLGRNVIGYVSDEIIMLRKPSDIRQEIERTRERITRTVEALRYKTDVPHRAQELVKETIEHAKEAVFPSHEPPPQRPTEPPTTQVDI